MCGKGLMWQSRTRLPVNNTPKEEESKKRWQKSEPRRWHRKRRDRRFDGRRPKHLQVTTSLRPANVRGKRAPGMRAPRNTNQFLMHEKYQLMHIRSDSVGTDSGSDYDLDPEDMDSYLGVLENAWGALLDSPDPELPSMCFGPPGFSNMDHEDSLQYFPSENDVLESEDFMQRDFKQFCDDVACI